METREKNTAELNDDQLEDVSGGVIGAIDPGDAKYRIRCSSCGCVFPSAIPNAMTCIQCGTIGQHTCIS